MHFMYANSTIPATVYSPVLTHIIHIHHLQEITLLPPLPDLGVVADTVTILCYRWLLCYSIQQFDRKEDVE